MREKTERKGERNEVEEKEKGKEVGTCQSYTLSGINRERKREGKKKRNRKK